MKRSLNKWHKVKKQAARRDHDECVICHAKATDVHHVVYRSQLGKDDINNVVCLCRLHHEMAHGVHARQMRQMFQAYLANHRR